MAPSCSPEGWEGAGELARRRGRAEHRLLREKAEPSGDGFAVAVRGAAACWGPPETLPAGSGIAGAPTPRSCGCRRRPDRARRSGGGIPRASPEAEPPVGRTRRRRGGSRAGPPPTAPFPAPLTGSGARGCHGVPPQLPRATPSPSRQRKLSSWHFSSALLSLLLPVGTRGSTPPRLEGGGLLSRGAQGSLGSALGAGMANVGPKTCC